MNSWAFSYAVTPLLILKMFRLFLVPDILLSLPLFFFLLVALACFLCALDALRSSVTPVVLVCQFPFFLMQ